MVHGKVLLPVAYEIGIKLRVAKLANCWIRLRFRPVRITPIRFARLASTLFENRQDADTAAQGIRS